ncbi:unnamed protein product [Haemonchus placei]|uniref:MFS domain-containing protein n=1 Tax=Haemonchus placei TaxID=6290 RepID=A0A0N4W0U2_HAEPC|nr:unnamed protein product [Haemonchus placei]
MSAILALSSIFQMGYANAYPNTAVNTFRKYINESEGGSLTGTSFTWIWSAILNIYFVGFIIGSAIAIPLADRIGRKCEYALSTKLYLMKEPKSDVTSISSDGGWCLVCGNTTNFVAAVLSTVSIIWLLPSLFLTSRIIFAIGAAISMNSLVLLLQESAPVFLRGLMSFNAEMAFVMTNMLGALAGMGSMLGTKLSWLIGYNHINCSVTCFPTLFSILLALHFPDSPQFLLLERSERRKAEKSVEFYHGTNGQDTAKVLMAYEKETPKSNGSVKELLNTKHVRSGLILGIVALQATTSIWPVIYYSTDFLIRENIDAELAELTSTVMLFVSCISTTVGMLVVEHCSRRYLLLGCGFMNMSALSMRGHSEVFSFALGPISWFITAELVPLQFRALCQSLAISSNQTISLILCFVTLPLYDKFGKFISDQEFCC